MLHLYVPELEDLWFRERMLADAQTMAYNHSYGGTIPFPPERWEQWYRRWVCPGDGKRFYRYLRDGEDFTGEVSYHFDSEAGIYLTDVLIDARFRRQGFGKRGLLLLCEAARANGIETLYDHIAIDNGAVKLFLECGFTEIGRSKEAVCVKKDLTMEKNVL